MRQKSPRGIATARLDDDGLAARRQGQQLFERNVLRPDTNNKKAQQAIAIIIIVVGLLVLRLVFDRFEVFAINHAFPSLDSSRHVRPPGGRESGS